MLDKGRYQVDDGWMEEVMELLYWLKTTEEEAISCGQLTGRAALRLPRLLA